jgi:hypothetical protein
MVQREVDLDEEGEMEEPSRSGEKLDARNVLRVECGWCRAEVGHRCQGRLAPPYFAHPARIDRANELLRTEHRRRWDAR